MINGFLYWNQNLSVVYKYDFKNKSFQKVPSKLNIKTSDFSCEMKRSQMKDYDFAEFLSKFTELSNGTKNSKLLNKGRIFFAK